MRMIEFGMLLFMLGPTFLRWDREPYDILDFRIVDWPGRCCQFGDSGIGWRYRKLAAPPASRPPRCRGFLRLREVRRGYKEGPGSGRGAPLWPGEMEGAQTTALDFPRGPTKRQREECVRVGRPSPQKRGYIWRIVEKGHSVAYVCENDGEPNRKNGRLVRRADAAHWVSGDRLGGSLPGAALGKECPRNRSKNGAPEASQRIQKGVEGGALESARPKVPPPP